MEAARSCEVSDASKSAACGNGDGEFGVVICIVMKSSPSAKSMKLLSSAGNEFTPVKDQDQISILKRLFNYIIYVILGNM